jgi:hypothetical protein
MYYGMTRVDKNPNGRTQRELGRALLAKSLQQPEGNLGPLNALASIAQGAAGGWLMKQGDQAEQEATASKQQALAQALQQYGKDPAAAASGIVAADPEYGGAAINMLMNDRALQERRTQFDQEMALRQKQADDERAYRQQQIQLTRDGVGRNPSAVQEWNFFSGLPPEVQKQYMDLKRAQQVIDLGGQKGVKDPVTGEITYLPVTPKPENMPGFKASQELAVDLAKGQANDQLALDPIQSLKGLNEKSFSSFAGVKRVAGRFDPTGYSDEKTNATDALVQARTDLAAPLAKQLGVNPTDRDFQASLDRIFDLNTTQESRAIQINALEQRIKDRQKTRGQQLENVIGSPQQPLMNTAPDFMNNLPQGSKFLGFE